MLIYSSSVWWIVIYDGRFQRTSWPLSFQTFVPLALVDRNLKRFYGPEYLDHFIENFSDYSTKLVFCPKSKGILGEGFQLPWYSFVQFLRETASAWQLCQFHESWLKLTKLASIFELHVRLKKLETQIERKSPDVHKETSMSSYFVVINFPLKIDCFSVWSKIRFVPIKSSLQQRKKYVRFHISLTCRRLHFRAHGSWISY